MNWIPTQSDLKLYRHFDAVISVQDILPYVSSPENVAKHRFMPFLHFTQEWRRGPIKRAGDKPIARKPKIRKIRYASRKDAYIFKYYREMLSLHYEAKLRQTGLSESVLAYRTIPKADGTGNKSNIEFAKEAFATVDELGKCTAVAIDISDYFGSMSHNRIKEVWCDLLNTHSLPEDHFAVFSALTKFRFVDRNDAYCALGYSEKKEDGSYKYKISPTDIPHQICTNSQFRELIVENKLVLRNEGESLNCGIPQGAPLSDLIANSYLFDFDLKMQEYAVSKGGRYFRYSDDILFILPGDGRTARAAYSLAQNEITKMGDQLKIKPEKTEITCYVDKTAENRCYGLGFSEVDGKLVKQAHNQGLSYLGFRYDYRKVYLRSSTISNLRGKIYRSAKAVATNHVDRYMDKDLLWLLENSPIDQLTQNFFQVEDFEEAIAKAEALHGSPFSKMTFFSYAERASEAFKSYPNSIMKQTLKVKSHIQKMLDKQIEKKHATRPSRLAHRRKLAP